LALDGAIKSMFALHRVVMVPIPFPSLVSIFLSSDLLNRFYYKSVTRDCDPLINQTKHASFLTSGPLLASGFEPA